MPTTNSRFSKRICKPETERFQPMTFDQLGADLGPVRMSYAVASSSSVPLLIGPVLFTVPLKEGGTQLLHIGDGGHVRQSGHRIDGAALLRSTAGCQRRTAAGTPRFDRHHRRVLSIRQHRWSVFQSDEPARAAEPVAFARIRHHGAARAGVSADVVDRVACRCRPSGSGRRFAGPGRAGHQALARHLSAAHRCG